MASKIDLIMTSANIRKKDDIDDQLIKAAISKSPRDSKGLALSIDASHTGFVNNNFSRYFLDDFTKKKATFYNPYPKPVLKEHNMMEGDWGMKEREDVDPVGRVYAAVTHSINKRVDGQTVDGILRLGSFITNEEEIDKIRDNRSLTVSISFRKAKAICSICGVDIINNMKNGKKLQEDDERCSHFPGRIYDGKQAVFDTYVKYFREVSTVYNPADAIAHIHSMYQKDNENIIDFSYQKYNSELEQHYSIQEVGYDKLTNGYNFDSETNEEKVMNKDEMELLAKSISETLAKSVSEAVDKAISKEPTTTTKNKSEDTNTAVDLSEPLEKLTSAIDSLQETIKSNHTELTTALDKLVSKEDQTDKSGDEGDKGSPSEDGSDNEKELKDQIDSLKSEVEELKKELAKASDSQPSRNRRGRYFG